MKIGRKGYLRFCGKWVRGRVCPEAGPIQLGMEEVNGDCSSLGEIRLYWATALGMGFTGRTAPCERLITGLDSFRFWLSRACCLYSLLGRNRCRRKFRRLPTTR